MRYQPRGQEEGKKRLEAEIVRVSQENPDFGYKKITQLLREKGYRINKKQVQRVRREEGLQLPPNPPRQRRQGVSTGLPQKAERANHVWCWDFMSDFTQRGGKLRVFNMIDEYTRECHCIHADRAINAHDVLRLLQEAIERKGAPSYIRSDNGPEFIAKAIQNWLAKNNIKTIYIDPGCPWQNGYAESFNSRFRIECLNRELIYTLSEARVIFSDWKARYNNVRPHRSLGLLTPAAFAKTHLLQGSDSGRATPSLRRSLQLNQNSKPG